MSFVLVLAMAVTAIAVVIISVPGARAAATEPSILATPQYRELKVGSVQLTIGTTNPVKITLVDEWEFIFSVYSTLVGYNKSYGVEPDLAVKWAPYGTTEWDIWITKNAYWVDPRTCARDGLGHIVGDCTGRRQVTGDDIAFTFNFYKANQNSMGLFRDYITEVVRAYFPDADPFHVRVQFTGPYAPAMDTFLALPMLPRYIWEAQGIGYSNPLPIGSGPLMAVPIGDKAIIPGDELPMDRNPYWHGGEVVGRQVFPNRVRVLSYANSAANSQGLVAGEVDLAMGPSASEWLGYLNRPGVLRQSVGHGFVGEMAVNVMTDALRAMNPSRFSIGGAYNNPNLLIPEVRYALHMATDRMKMINNALLGLGEPADTLIPKASSWHLDYQDYVGSLTDLDDFQLGAEEFPESTKMARDLLHRAGWVVDCNTGQLDIGTSYPLCKGTAGAPDTSTRLEFRFATLSAESWWKTAAEGVVEDAKKAGILLNLALYSTNQMNNQIWWPLDYDVWLWDWVFTPASDPSTGMLSVQTCTNLLYGTANDNGYCEMDPVTGKWVFDEVYNASVRELDLDRRRALTDQMQRMIYDYASYNLPFYRRELYAMTEVRWTHWGNWDRDRALPFDVGITALLPTYIWPIDQRPPMFSLPSEYRAFLARPLQFSVAALDPEGTYPLAYRWDFNDLVDSNGDGIYDNDADATTATPTWTYSTSPPADRPYYKVTLRVSESGGEWFWTEKARVLVSAPTGTAPVISGVSSTPLDPTLTDASTDFATAAVDPLGLPVTYSWNFGDGTITPFSSSPTASHHYGAADTYTVKVTARNTVPASSEYLSLVTIAPNLAPVLAPMDLQFATAGSARGFAAFASDQNSRDALTYSWNFGDGGTGTGNPIDHTYATEGTYTLTYSVSDPYAHSDTKTTSVTVFPTTGPTNTAPDIWSMTAAPLARYQYGTITFTAEVSDKEGQELTWNWDFNKDGVVDFSERTGRTLPGTHVTRLATYVYTTSGTVRPTLTIVDELGKSTFQTLTFSVIANSRPTATALASSAPYPAPGQLITFTTTAQDIDGNNVAYSWDFGDGSPPVTGVLVSPSTPTTLTTTHTFTTEEDFLVAVSLDDGLGGLGGNAVVVPVVVPKQIVVALEANWTKLYVGQTMDIKTWSTVEGAPLPSAAATATVTTGGSLTATSGNTDANGFFKTTVRPLAGSVGTTITVNVSVDKAPHSKGWKTWAISVVPAGSMTMAATTKTVEMMSYETAVFNIRLTNATGAGLLNALITASSPSGGTFTPAEQLGGGDYVLRWSAPTVTTQTVVSISIRAKVGGFLDATQRLSLKVDPNKAGLVPPAQLFVLGLSASVSPGGSVTIRAYVYTIEGYVVAGAAVVPSLRFPTQGTLGAVTDELNGLYTFVFTASSSLSPGAIVTIRIDASKAGYAAGTTSVRIQIVAP